VTYIDSNSDRICQWEDLQPDERITAVHTYLQTGKYLTQIGGLWHKLEAQDQLGLKKWLIEEARSGGSSILHPFPKLTKLEKRKIKRHRWREFWLPKLLCIRGYVHQRSKNGWTRPRTCSEISKWVGLPPYKISRIAQKAIQLGFIAKKGRCYVPKKGRPPALKLSSAIPSHSIIRGPQLLPKQKRGEP